MVKKYLNWVEYKTLLSQKDKFGFMNETARESINNLKDYNVVLKTFKHRLNLLINAKNLLAKIKTFISFFYINSLPLNNKNRAGLKCRSLKK